MRLCPVFADPVTNNDPTIYDYVSFSIIGNIFGSKQLVAEAQTMPFTEKINILY